MGKVIYDFNGEHPEGVDGSAELLPEEDQPTDTELAMSRALNLVKIAKGADDQPRDERGRWTGEHQEFEREVILSGRARGGIREDLPIKEGIKASSSVGFGDCTQQTLKEHAKSGAEVHVGMAVRRDRYEEAFAAFKRDGSYWPTEAFPHAWNVKDGQIVDRTLGSEDASRHIYIGFKVPDEVLSGIKDGNELARWHTSYVHAKVIMTGNLNKGDQPRDEHGRFAPTGGANNQLSFKEADKLGTMLEDSEIFDEDKFAAGTGEHHEALRDAMSEFNDQAAETQTHEDVAESELEERGEPDPEAEKAAIDAQKELAQHAANVHEKMRAMRDHLQSLADAAGETLRQYEEGLLAAGVGSRSKS